MFCNHCGAKNQDEAVSCLACGQPPTQIPSSSVTSDTRRFHEEYELKANSMGYRPSEGKRAIFVSVIQYFVELAIALLVLFHDYGSKDTTVIVSLLVAAYGMIRAHLSGESVISAMFFLDLSKLIRRNTASDEEQDEGHEDVTVLVRRDLPYTWAGVLFHIALAALAAIKLLLTLLL
jgi:zinc-ribbon domain